MSDCSAGWSVGPDLARLPDWRIVPGEPGVMVVTFAEGELPPGEWTVIAGYNDLDLITGTAVADGDVLTITFDAEASADLFNDGILTVPWRLYLDGAWWGGGNIRPASLHDDPGPCGATIVLSPPGSDPITVVVSRCAEDGEPGPPGADGREVELRVQGTMLQWRYTSPPGLPWADLFDLGEGGDGASDWTAAFIAPYSQVSGADDPISLRDWSGSQEILSLPRAFIPPGARILVIDDAEQRGLWDWDSGAGSFSRSSEQPAGGEAVFVALLGAGGAGWMTLPLTDPSTTFTPAGARTDRAEVWTEPLTVRRPLVGIEDESGVTVPFLTAEAGDPGGDSTEEVASLVAASITIPGLGQIIAPVFEARPWNPLAAEFADEKVFVGASFSGVDDGGAPTYRLIVRSGAGSVFAADLAPVMAGDPVTDDDLATKRYVDASVGGPPDPPDSDAMLFRGDWDAGTEYSEPSDVVLTASGAWVAVADSSGTDPEDDEQTAWRRISRTTGPVIPTDGTQSWEWPDSGLTDEAIAVPPPFDGYPGGSITRTGTFGAPNVHHTLYVPPERTDGSLGLRFENPGPGRTVDTFMEVLNASPLTLSIFAVAGDDSVTYVAGAPGEKVSLWRVVVNGTESGDPSVFAGRIQLHPIE